MLFFLVFVQLVIYVSFGLLLGLKEKFNLKKNIYMVIETTGKIFFLNTIPRTIIYNWINLNHNLDSFYLFNFLANLVLYTGVQDILFWIIHKILHLEPAYSMIHKQHHSSYKTKTYGIFGKYMSTCDFVIFELLNFPLKILFFCQDIYSMCLVDIIDYVLTICSHSRLFNLNSHHKIHHWNQNYNYGITPLSDQIFHTIKYKKTFD